MGVFCLSISDIKIKTLRISLKKIEMDIAINFRVSKIISRTDLSLNGVETMVKIIEI